MNYNGPSMQPFLKPGDRLNKRGDSQKIGHRVVEKYSTGVRTWGDNNSHIDPEIVGSADIKGRVVSVKRGDMTVAIRGGLGGRVTGFLRRTKSRIDTQVSKRLHSIYHLLSKSCIFTRVLTIRLISFKRDIGVETQLLWRGKVIGRRPAGDIEWRIKKPYKLFVDVKSLPKK